MKGAPVALSLIAALALGGCAGKAKYDPWCGSRDLLTSGAVIAIGPLKDPGFIAETDPIRAEFDSLMIHELEMAGYSVVSSKVTTPIFDSASEEVGGIYDPATGDMDRDKMLQASEIMHGTLREQFQVDFVVLPVIVQVPAHFEAGSASWDGTSQNTESLLKAILTGGLGRSGTVPALSFMAIVTDMNGDAVYLNRGGIEICGRYKNGAIEWVPDSELLRNPERNAKSVRIAFKELVASATGGS